MYQPEVLYLLGKLRQRELLRQAKQMHLITSALKNRSGTRGRGLKIPAWIQAQVPGRKEGPSNPSLISDQCCTVTEM